MSLGNVKLGLWLTKNEVDFTYTQEIVNPTSQDTNESASINSDGGLEVPITTHEWNKLEAIYTSGGATHWVGRVEVSQKDCLMCGYTMQLNEGYVSRGTEPLCQTCFDKVMKNKKS